MEKIHTKSGVTLGVPHLGWPVFMSVQTRIDMGLYTRVEHASISHHDETDRMTMTQDLTRCFLTRSIVLPTLERPRNGTTEGRVFPRLCPRQGGFMHVY